MKLKTPKITIVTPLYNRADFIGETINSILKQDFSDYEFLIIDDGSTDNSKGVVEKYLDDKRIKYIFQKNKGEAEAVNLGWKLARGEYFTQINSDDPILPGLFKEMVSTLDKNKESVLAYPDFNIIDKNGNKISETKNPDWIFTEALSAYSCFASSPGTFIRRNFFNDWKKIRDKRFRHISDNYMYFKMALRGPFSHIPKTLATWRQHDSGISSKRYESINEIEIWFEEYFNQKDVPDFVMNCKNKTERSMYNYFIDLLSKADINNKEERIKYYKDKIKKTYYFNNLQVGDNDLIGNKFNGHDLHQYLREKNIESNHLVWNKESQDPNTFVIGGNRDDRQELRNYAHKIKEIYNLDKIWGSEAYDLLYSELFLNADVVHLHLIHNLSIDLHLLPLLSRLKPIIWTVHDPWPLSGHCVQHFNCNRWQTGCGDCPYLNVDFSMLKDNTALNYEIKKTCIQNSQLNIVVASKYMAEKLTKSEIFKNSVINLIPFGVNQAIFKPKDKKEVRMKLGLPVDSIVILFRNDNPAKKGLDYIQYLIEGIKDKKNIFLITVGGNELPIPNGYEYKSFGWLNDDNLLSDIYNAADLFLMPSIQESFGMMAIEAMSCGVLPIVLKGTALPEVVNSPACGVAIERDKEEFLKQVQYFINNPHERNIKAKACLTYARDNYNKEIYVEKIITLYKKVIKQHKKEKSLNYLLNQLKLHMQETPILQMHTLKNPSTKNLGDKVENNKMHLNLTKVRYILKRVVIKTKKYFINRPS